MKHNIIPVLEHYGVVNVRETHGWQKIKCPIHEDSHASAGVNTDDNIFVCHACGSKGDTYKIIMEKEGVGFREAVEIAKSITGDDSSYVRGFNKKTSGRRSTSTSRKYVPPSLSRGRRVQ